MSIESKEIKFKIKLCLFDQTYHKSICYLKIVTYFRDYAENDFHPTALKKLSFAKIDL